MNACHEMDGLLAERASGEMAAEDAERLDAHLTGCERCRNELRAYQETFALARPEAPETRVGDLEVSTFSAYQRRRRRRVTGFTIGAGFVAAAVAASVLIAPAFFTLRSLPRQSQIAMTGLTSDASAGVSGQSATTSTQLALGSDTSDEVAPEDAALAALDEIDSF